MAKKGDVMSNNQIKICTARMAEKDKASAELFAQMMREASALNIRATAMRKGAWAMYREVTGLTKRPLYGKEKASHAD